MSNKSILQSNNDALSSNNLDLQSLIDQANALPDAGGVELPELSNEGAASDLLSGKQLIDGDGDIITGTFSIDNELTAQDDLISQIQAAVDSLPEAGSSGGTGSNTTMISVTVSERPANSAYYINASGELAYADSRGTIETLNGIILYYGSYVLTPLSGDYIYSKLGEYQLIKFNSSGGSFTVGYSGGAN